MKHEVQNFNIVCGNPCNILETNGLSGMKLETASHWSAYKIDKANEIFLVADLSKFKFSLIFQLKNPSEIHLFYWNNLN